MASVLRQKNVTVIILWKLVLYQKYSKFYQTGSGSRLEMIVCAQYQGKVWQILFCDAAAANWDDEDARWQDSDPYTCNLCERHETQ